MSQAKVQKPKAAPVDDASSDVRYGNWRKPESPGIWRFGPVGSAVGIGGVVVAFIVMSFAGLIPALVIMLILAVVLTPLVWVGPSQRNAWASLGTRLSFNRNRRKRRTIHAPAVQKREFLSAPNRLPGLLSETRLRVRRDAVNRPFAIVEMPAVNHYSVLLRCKPEGGELVDPETRDQWVASWGDFLAGLSHDMNLAGASVTVESVPDGGEKLAANIDRMLNESAPELAKEMMAESRDSWPQGSSTIRTWITLTWTRTPSMSKVMTEDRLVAMICDKLPGLCEQASEAGCGDVTPMLPQDVAAIVQSAYRPSDARGFDLAAAKGEVPSIPWQDTGPAMMKTAWDHIRHEDAWSQVWKMSLPPTSAVKSSVLRKLLAPHPDLTRKRVTILYRFIPPAKAADIADRDVRTANTKAQSRKGIAPAERLRALEAATQTADEQASGAGLIQFGMLVTATVQASEDMEQAQHVVDQLAGTSRVRLHKATGTQAASFAAGLGIGLVLTSYTKIPAFLKENL